MENIDHNNNSEILIVKSTGESVPFSRDKLFQSLIKSGAEIDEANHVIRSINEKLFPGISTKSIYRQAYKELKRSSRVHAARYNLKNAIMQLGPGGYAFEKFIGELFTFQGFKVQIGLIIAGNCVNHEIDVLAEKGNHYRIVECKYHNQRGNFCNVKVPLYIHSRYKDVTEEWKTSAERKNRTHEGWVVTNTRFSDDATKYGNCVGLRLMGWDYPVKNSLKDLVETSKLYPLTCLTTLTIHEKNLLLEKDLVLCTTLWDDRNHLASLGIKPSRIDLIIKEAKQLCNGAIPIRSIGVQ